MEPMFEWFSDAFDNFCVFIENTMNLIKEFFVNGWNSIVSFFTETIPAFIESILEWFNQLPYKLGYIIGEALGYIMKFGLDLWNFATITVPEFINEILKWFAELPSKIWTFFA